MKYDERILKEARALADWTREKRHALHRIPELGFEEYKTQAYIMGQLDTLGIPYRIERTGVIAEITGGRPGRRVALRADIDALPMQEQTGLPYASEHPGKMHACGHDVHAAVLLGAANLLHGLRDELPGSIRLLFQPAEETTGGAEPLIEAGAMRDVDAVYGLHVAAQAPVGRIATRPGAMYAATDEFFIDVLGKSGHGAHPSHAVDAIVIAAHIVTALQTLVTREIEATEPAVITVGSIHGGTACNIICDRVEIVGTLRTVSRQTRDLLGRRIPEVARGVAKAMRGDVEVRIRHGYCACVNDPKEAARVLRTAERLFGRELTRELSVSSMGAEDFAYYLLEAPGAIYHLGCGSEASVHNVHFSVDDGCLPAGIAMQAALAVEYLLEGEEAGT